MSWCQIPLFLFKEKHFIGGINMKLSLWLAAGLLTFSIAASGCGEQEKEAEERGKIPKETIKKAEESVNKAVQSLEDSLKKAGEELDK